MRRPTFFAFQTVVLKLPFLADSLVRSSSVGTWSGTDIPRRSGGGSGCRTRRCIELLAALIGTPVLTVNKVKRVLGVSADHAIADLVALGILTGTARQRHRVFAAHESVAVPDKAPERRRGPSLTP